jgi:hypothetical protein
LPLIRHSLNSLRITSSVGFACVGSTSRIESRSGPETLRISYGRRISSNRRKGLPCEIQGQLPALQYEKIF